MMFLRTRVSWLNICIVLPIVLFGFLFLALSFNKAKDGGIFLYYANIAGDSGASVLRWACLFLVVVFAVRLAFLLLYFGLRSRPLGEFLASVFSFQSVWIYAKARLFLFGALFFGIALFGLAIGQVNVFSADHLQDALLVKADLFLTGTFPAFELAKISYPAAFARLVEFSFFYLGIGMVFFAAYVFLRNKELFREMLAAFFLANLFMLAGWIAFPALSPHDRFLDNAYALPVSAEMQARVSAYRPQAEIQSVLESVRSTKDATLKTLPTTAMPSAHVVWSLMLLFFAARVSLVAGLIASPFAFMSLFGTVFFAQHYFVDIPAGILVFAVVMLCIRALKRADEQNLAQGGNPAV